MITQSQYARIMGSNPSYFNKGQLNRPVESVSWSEAVEYCRRLTEFERIDGQLPRDHVYRLPTEAEWEYAARAGTTNRFCFGEDPLGDLVAQYAWHYTSGQTFNVGGKRPNPFGLYDVFGNVAWCMDYYDFYPGGPSNDPEGPLDSSYRASSRRGVFRFSRISGSATRDFAEESKRMRGVGFRIVLAFAGDRDSPSVDLVYIEPSVFFMGSLRSELGHKTDEEPVGEVLISKPYWIGRFEITQLQYSELMGVNPSFYSGPMNRPVEQVSWTDASEYCRRLTEVERSYNRVPEGYEYRLPTEAEWEYAARAGTTTRYSFGNDVDGSSIRQYACILVAPTCGVGSKAPNPWGIVDVHGNVAEWCHDWYGPYPRLPLPERLAQRTAIARSFAAAAGTFRQTIVRQHEARCLPTTFGRQIGFRVVLGPIIMR